MTDQELIDRMAMAVAPALVAHFFLFLADIAAALVFASAFELAPHAFRLSSNLVGSPFGLRSAPGILPIRARNEARRGLSPDLTGGLRLEPEFSAS